MAPDLPTHFNRSAIGASLNDYAHRQHIEGTADRVPGERHAQALILIAGIGDVDRNKTSLADVYEPSEIQSTRQLARAWLVQNQFHAIGAVAYAGPGPSVTVAMKNPEGQLAL